MKILGIDFGEKKIGLAIAEGSLAEPLVVFRPKNHEELFSAISALADDEKIEKIIIGISEGKMAEKSKDFARELAEYVNIPIEFEDEALSTYDAKRLSIEAGMNRKKRRKMEDAFSATLILQSYLDRN